MSTFYKFKRSVLAYDTVEVYGRRPQQPQQLFGLHGVGCVSYCSLSFLPQHIYPPHPTPPRLYYRPTVLHVRVDCMVIWSCALTVCATDAVVTGHCIHTFKLSPKYSLRILETLSSTSKRPIHFLSPTFFNPPPLTPNLSFLLP